ncbi:MAG: serine hydrolase [Elainellaceae cyanobacterium]
MADYRRRSQPSQRKRSARSPRSDVQATPSRRGRSGGAAASRRSRPEETSLGRASARAAASGQPQNPSRPRRASDSSGRSPRPGGGGAVDPNAGSIVLRPSSQMTRSNGSVRSRDGRRMPIGPDPRRRPEVGAYASAFGGRRSQATAAASRNSSASAHTLVPRSPTLSAFPGAKAAGTYRPVQRLSPRPVSAKPSGARKPRRKPVRRPVPPWVYGIRLLILGVGMSAIAGTVLSVLNPSQQELAANDAEAQSATQANRVGALMATPESGRSLISSLNLGQDMSSLSQNIRSIVETYPDLKPGVFIYDMDTGNYVNVNGTEPFAAASMIKVPILIAFFQDVESGALNPDEILTMETEDVASGSGNMQFQSVGTEFTALDVASQMIITSDNTATNMLIRRLGGMERLNERFLAWGLQYTTLSNLLPDLEGTNRTSPRELVELMTLVSREELLSGRSRDRLLHIMARTQTNTLLPQGLSNEATIFHKTGDIGSMLGDVGLVDVPNGKRYAIAVQVQRPHNDARAGEVIRQISNQVYSTMEDASLNASPSSAPSDLQDRTETSRPNAEAESSEPTPMD